MKLCAVVLEMPLLRSRNKKFEEATQLLVEGRADAAIPLLRDFLARHPEHVDAMVALAVALLEVQEKPDQTSAETLEALNLLDSAAKIAPKNPIPMFNKGVCLRKLGQPKEALKSFQRSLEIERKQPLALLHIAELYYELQDWENAIEYAKKVLVIDPGLESALVWVPNAVEQMGKLPSKRNILKK